MKYTVKKEFEDMTIGEFFDKIFPTVKTTGKDEDRRFGLDEDERENEVDLGITVPHFIRSVIKRGHEIVEANPEPPSDPLEFFLVVEGKKLVWTLINLYLALNGIDRREIQAEGLGYRSGWRLVKFGEAGGNGKELATAELQDLAKFLKAKLVA